jgi:hypothetical protein
VNGAVAGCHPEYMPILVAAVEAVLDPAFHVTHAGSTSGWEPLVIVNGPLAARLGFNHATGVARIGHYANTTVGRFLRLYLRNLGNLRTGPGGLDMATFGAGLNVALAEDEEALAAIGWPTFAVERGFSPETTVVSVQGTTGVSPSVASAGSHATDHLALFEVTIGRGTWLQSAWAGIHGDRVHPLLVLSPAIAGVLARDGWSKPGIRQRLSEQLLAEPAWLAELARANGLHVPDGVAAGPPVRAFPDPEQIGVLVAGDPNRNRSFGYGQLGRAGAPVSRAVR